MKDYRGISAAAQQPILLPPTVAPSQPQKQPTDDPAIRAKVAEVVHPERKFADLKSLTVEIFRLKGESTKKHDPEVAATLRMRVAMLQRQWTDMATAAGIAKPTARLNPFTASGEEVARAFMWSEAGGVIPNAELAADGGKAFTESVRDAVALRVFGFPAVLELHKGKPEEQKALLRSELKRLGDTPSTDPTQTVDSLSARRAEVLSQRNAEEIQRSVAAEGAAKKQLYIGLDGFVGTAESVQAYERSERVKAAVSDSTTGSILANYLAGGDIEKMRALGALGSTAEGIAGGAGTVIEGARKTQTTERVNEARSPRNTAVVSGGGAPPKPAMPQRNPTIGGSTSTARPATTSPPPNGSPPPATRSAPTTPTQPARPAAPIPAANVPSNVAIRTKEVGAVEPFNPVGAPLRTTTMKPRYAGEDRPGNSVWPGGQVTYLRTEAERAPFRIHAREVQINGKREVRLFDAQGKLFDSRAAKTVGGSSNAIFVMNANGDIFASNYQKVAEFHHSTLAGGQPVAAAGELTVIDGRIVAISNRSGHYRPDDAFTEQALTSLRRRGVDLAGVEVRNEVAGTRRVLNAKGE